MRPAPDSSEPALAHRPVPRRSKSATRQASSRDTTNWAAPDNRASVGTSAPPRRRSLPAKHRPSHPAPSRHANQPAPARVRASRSPSPAPSPRPRKSRLKGKTWPVLGHESSDWWMARRSRPAMPRREKPARSAPAARPHCSTKQATQNRSRRPAITHHSSSPREQSWRATRDGADWRRQPRAISGSARRASFAA